MEQHTQPLPECLPPPQSLAEFLAFLTDQRAPRGIRYAFFPLLMIILLAKLAQANTPSAIADWADGQADWLRENLQVNWARMPHHSTYRRLLQRGLLTTEFAQQADRFLQQRLDPQERHFNLDGKTLRGTIPSGATQGVHLLALQQASTNCVVAQRAVGAKENEISNAPVLLKTVDLTGKIISGDAMHAQRCLSQQIVAGGGDYLWTVKQNQLTLWKQLAASLGDARSLPPDVETTSAYDKGHGRIEWRQLTTSKQVANILDWPQVA